MRVAYFDTFAGISGDMTLAALIHAGLSVDDLRTELNKLPVSGWELQAQDLQKHGIAAVQVRVSATSELHQAHHHHHGRSLTEILDLLHRSTLDETVRHDAELVFRRLAEAEGAVHGKPPEEVHFHEVGGLDSLVDVVGAVVGLQLLGVQAVFCSPLPLSHGTVECAHGTLPVPAPAVLKLVEGLPTVPLDLDGETVTPTGAALMAVLAQEFGPPPPMTVQATGYGAGSSEWSDRPNVLRLVLGVTREDLGQMDRVVLLQANIDDMSPELFEHAFAQCFGAGALDVWTTPVTMKKGRPAQELSVLTNLDHERAVAAAMFEHTTTFGVRRAELTRHCLPREWREVQTPYGKIRLKIARRGEREVTLSPEYEDCLRAAREHQVPLKVVYDAARSAL